MNDKIKAVLVEAVQSDLKETINGKETVRKGGRRSYWYAQDYYPRDVLDYGDYDEVAPDSILCPATADGVEVQFDKGMINDLVDIREVNVAELIDEALGLNDGEWIEKYFSDWRIRVTAREELPPLSAEKTVAYSDLSDAAKARIRINGKPLYLPGTLKRGTSVWLPDLSTFILDAVATAMQAKGRYMAKVSVVDDPLVVRRGETGIRFNVEAPTFENLVSFLRNIGVVNPETVNVVRKTGDGDEIKSFRAVIHCVDNLD